MQKAAVDIFLTSENGWGARWQGMPRKMKMFQDWVGWTLDMYTGYTCAKKIYARFWSEGQTYQSDMQSVPGTDQPALRSSVSRNNGQLYAVKLMSMSPTRFFARLFKIVFTLWPDIHRFWPRRYFTRLNPPAFYIASRSRWRPEKYPCWLSNDLSHAGLSAKIYRTCNCHLGRRTALTVIVAY